MIVLDLIVFDDQLSLSVDHEYTLLLRVLDVVVHYAGLARSLAATRDVSFTLPSILLAIIYAEHPSVNRMP